MYDLPPVHPDLERLIRLQSLDQQAAEARRLQTTIPETQRALDSKLEAARAVVAEARTRQAANQDNRRALDKDVSAVQTRLSRYKDQLMEVKTNREYHAMQHEIETAQGEVKRIEDLMLELMVAGDEITAALKSADAGVKSAEQQISKERAELDTELATAGKTLEEVLAARADLVASIPPKVVALYDQVAKARRGVAVTTAVNGLCSECHVRLRPMVYAEVRHNSGIVQCDSCQRILYYVPPPAEAAAPSA